MKDRFAVVSGARYWYVIDRYQGGRTVSQWMEAEGAERMARILNRKEVAKDEQHKEA